MKVLTPNRSAAWVGALVLTSVVSALAIELAVRHLGSQADPRYGLSFSYGLRLPIAVVQDVPNPWVVLTLFWAAIAALLILGWRFAVSVGRQPSVTFGYIIGAVIAVGLVYTLFPALFAGDLYAYVSYGRLYGVYHINPYHLMHGFDVRSDAILSQCFRFYGNPPPNDNYGPLWTLMAGIVGRLEADVSLLCQLWTYRVMALAAAVIAAAGLWRMLGSIAAGERAKRVVTFAFHPVVLFEAAAGGHNDMLMVAPAIWSFALSDVYPLAAGLLMGVSIGVKYVSVIVLPFLLIRIAQKSGVQTAVLSAVVALAVPIMSFFPFWVGFETLHPLASQLNDYRTSPDWLLALPFYIFQKADATVADHLTWIRLFQLTLTTTAITIIAISVLRYARSMNIQESLRAIASALWASASIYPWYVMWLAPALVCNSAWARYVYWFGALVFLRYLQDIVRQPDTALAYNVMLALLACVTGIFLFVPLALVRRRLALPTAREPMA